MPWWLKGITSRYFGWVRNPSEANFSYFWNQGKNQKFFFPGKIGIFRKISIFLSGNIGIYRKISVFIEKIGDFSSIFLLPIFPPENLFQHRRKLIFCRKIDRKNRFFCPWQQLRCIIERRWRSPREVPSLGI